MALTIISSSGIFFVSDIKKLSHLVFEQVYDNGSKIEGQYFSIIAGDLQLIFQGPTKPIMDLWTALFEYAKQAVPTSQPFTCDKLIKITITKY